MFLLKICKIQIQQCHPHVVTVMPQCELNVIRMVILSEQLTQYRNIYSIKLVRKKLCQTEKSDSKYCNIWVSKLTKPFSITPDLSILDLVSMILLRLDTLKPYALPLCPLFIKFPNAKTTSRTCLRSLLLITSRDAHRMARNETRKNKIKDGY